MIFRIVFCGKTLLKNSEEDSLVKFSGNTAYISLLEIYSGLFHIKVLVSPAVKTLYNLIFPKIISPGNHFKI